MTDGIRATIRQMTGYFVPGCPWRAFATPLVRDVMSAVQFHESGNLQFALPTPSHRLVEGIAFWNAVYNRVYTRQLEIERQERERSEATGARIAPPRNRRRR